MADSILRLKVDSQEYEGKIKRASQGLLHLEQSLNKAGKSFDSADKEAVDFVGGLGKMQTVSNTAKGKVGELSAAFVNLSQMYNRMSDDAKRGEFGQALGKSLEEIKKRTIDAKNELQQLNSQLNNVKVPDMPSQAGGLLGGGGKLDGMLQVFGGNMLTKAAGWAASFASEIGDCVKQGIELAKQGEGVRMAFEKLGRGDLLQGLRDATHGTVTDLELMKAAVKFDDFKLPVKELGTMLAFAQQKAKDTGQSVDYMVDSIVTGLGRKSLMILDNLGLSAADIKEKMKETGDMTTAVGAIIREQMQKSGDYIETASDRATKANVDLENAMTRLGQTFQPLADAGNSMWTSLKIGAINLLNDAIEPLISRLTEAGRLQKALANINAPAGEGTTLAQKHLGVLGHYSGTREQKQVLAEKQLAIYGREEAKWWHEAAKYREAYNRELERGGNYSSALHSYKTKWDIAEANAKGWAKTAADYRQGLDAVLNPAAPVADAGTTTTIKHTGGRGGGKVTPVKVEEVFPEGSMKALQKEMAELQKAQQLVTDTEGWKDYQRQIDEVTKKMDALKGVNVEVDEELAKLEAPIEVNVEANADMRTDFERLQDSIRIKISEKNVEVDENSLRSLMQVAMENGIEGLDIDFTSVLTQMVEGADVPPAAWQALADKINEQLKNMGLEPIKLDVETGNIVKTGAQTEKSWQAAAHAVSSVGSALERIENPGLKIIGIIGQAIANIALGFAQATASKANTAAGVWGWVAGIATGLSTMISTISAIHKATGYAEGGVVKGSTYSGDQVMANHGEIGLNTGELVLNKAQTGALNSMLEGGSGSGLNIAGEVRGEDIVLVANRYLNRTGKGELVTWKD